ncbi:FMN-binding protein (plasmid) [Curtobacterium flaccumfaciens]|uniref:FMN-binding protein n=1 Tax=Curtobacterium TaxID=2034 RepID=UPI00217F0570|nr:FMN-binding protein [Curtobacterium flaccumfaciens]MCS6563654.1 FMN-binding protein [Curtobacterium flaccumfaciens pv. poinsettiae]UXN16955.1 FMN-binding protein [Curtobacterium flaccumfaciens pv. poinsettiae]UXN27194.1 FMN-binding protein [Curtobacterium flaccumfaciens]UXN30539.1 FMN-binding protein [Curtobacterium flaccumfaciens]
MGERVGRYDRNRVDGRQRQQRDQRRHHRHREDRWVVRHRHLSRRHDPDPVRSGAGRDRRCEQGRSLTPPRCSSRTATAGRCRSSQQAAPILRQEALQAQSAQIQSVSGATFTSEGYTTSVQSAIDKAGL